MDGVLLASEDERRACLDGYAARDRDRPRERDTLPPERQPSYRVPDVSVSVHVALLLLAASDGKVMTSAANTAQHSTEITIFA